MKEEQQRIAIAEACGWIDCEHIESLGFCLGKHKEGRVQYDSGHSVLPDYLNDLNAMHEAEKALRKPMKGSDTDTIIGDRMHKYAELIGYAFDATAAQRAEAFLKTIGKWEDTKGTLV